MNEIYYPTNEKPIPIKMKDKKKRNKYEVELIQEQNTPQGP